MDNLTMQGLAEYRRFIIYKSTPSATRHGKFDKLPINWKTGQLASIQDSVNWMTLAEAKDQLTNYVGAYGLGFVFTPELGLYFIDIDNCLTDQGWSDLAKSIVIAFTGAYVEVSQSGRGLHIIGKGKLPPHSCKNTAYGLELYSESRFVALTGTHATGDANFIVSSDVTSWLVSTYFPPATTVSASWTDTPCEGWNGNRDDDELIRRALRSKSAGAAFSKRAHFSDLWEANVAVLREAFPDENRDYDASSAVPTLTGRISP